MKTTPNHTSIEHPASPDYTKIPEPAYFNPTTNPQQNPPKQASITEPTKQKVPIQAQTETKITLRERVKHEDGRTALKDKRRDISPIETPFNDNIYEQKIEARHIRQRTRVNLTGDGNHEEKIMEEKLSEVFYLQLPGNTTLPLALVDFPTHGVLTQWLNLKFQTNGYITENGLACRDSETPQIYHVYQYNLRIHGGVRKRWRIIESSSEEENVEDLNPSHNEDTLTNQTHRICNSATSSHVPIQTDMESATNDESRNTSTDKDTNHIISRSNQSRYTIIDSSSEDEKEAAEYQETNANRVRNTIQTYMDTYYNYDINAPNDTTEAEHRVLEEEKALRYGTTSLFQRRSDSTRPVDLNSEKTIVFRRNRSQEHVSFDQTLLKEHYSSLCATQSTTTGCKYQEGKEENHSSNHMTNEQELKKGPTYRQLTMEEILGINPLTLPDRNHLSQNR